MAQWYAQVGSQRFGPVELDVLRQWVAEGRVKATDLVWSDGMAAWQPAGSVPELFALGQQGGPPPVPSALFPGLPGQPPGTGGTTPNTELLSQAWRGLGGRWGLPIGFCLLVWLISMGIQIVPYLGWVAGVLVQGAFVLGQTIFFLAISRGAKGEIGMMFFGFRLFGKAFGANLLIGLFVILWSLLLIIPGIIAGLAYSQAFYILADNPNLGALEAIDRSKAMMQGKKWKLFCLGAYFSLIGLLGILTLGIGFLWISPLMAAASARFYDDLALPAASAEAAAPQA